MDDQPMKLEMVRSGVVSAVTSVVQNYQIVLVVLAAILLNECNHVTVQAFLWSTKAWKPARACRL